MTNTLIQINQNGMGAGDTELGLILINNYLKLTGEEKNPPRVIAFYNEGVRLVCEGSTALEQLQALEDKGIKLMACKTCLKHLGLMDKMKVGIPGTMMDIIELQKVAEKVITL